MPPKNRQVLFGWDEAATTGNGTNNQPFLSNYLGGASSQHDSEPIVAGGTLCNWRVKLGTAPGGTATRVYTIHKNDVATGLTLSFGPSDTELSIAAAVHFDAGDTIRLQDVRANSPAATTIHSAAVWIPDTDNEFIYGWSTGSQLDVGKSIPLINGNVFAVTTDPWSVCCVSVDGTVTAHRVKLRTAPGVGNSRSYVIYKNGVAQDGAGGTPDTTVLIADTATAATATFSLPVVAGDLLGVQFTNGGTPASTTWMGGSCVIVPNEDGDWMTSHATVAGNLTQTSYNVVCGQAVSWTTTEQPNVGPQGPGKYWLRALFIETAVAPGVGASWTLTMRKNQQDTPLTVTVSGAVQTANSVTLDPPGVEFDYADTINLKLEPSLGTPPGATSARIRTSKKGKLGKRRLLS